MVEIGTVAMLDIVCKARVTEEIKVVRVRVVVGMPSGSEFQGHRQGLDGAPWNPWTRSVADSWMTSSDATIMMHAQPITPSACAQHGGTMLLDVDAMHDPHGLMALWQPSASGAGRTRLRISAAQGPALNPDPNPDP